MKKLLTIFVLAGVLGAGVFVGATTLGQGKAELQCQPGEFDAGGFCRTIPTGCPYGDSVPMDKCEPTTPEEKAVVEPESPPAPKETSQCQ